MKTESVARYGRQRIDMPTMYRRKKDQTGRWPKLLLKLSRLVNRVRSQASADIAIMEAERSVRRKIKAAGIEGRGTTQGKNE